MSCCRPWKQLLILSVAFTSHCQARGQAPVNLQASDSVQAMAPDLRVDLTSASQSYAQGKGRSAGTHPAARAMTSAGSLRSANEARSLSDLSATAGRSSMFPAPAQNSHSPSLALAQLPSTIGPGGTYTPDDGAMHILPVMQGQGTRKSQPPHTSQGVGVRSPLSPAASISGSGTAARSSSHRAPAGPANPNSPPKH